MNQDSMESFIRVGPNFIPLASYQRLRAERRRELVKAIAFIVLIIFVMAVMLWVTP